MLREICPNQRNPDIFPLAMFVGQCPSSRPLPPFSFLSRVTSQGNCGFVCSPNQNLTHHNLVCGVSKHTKVINNYYFPESVLFLHPILDIVALAMMEVTQATHFKGGLSCKYL